MKKTVNSITVLAALAAFSLAMSQKPKESPTKVQKPIKMSGKSLGHFGIHIVSKDKGKDGLELTAQVQSRTNMLDSNYNWKIPDHARIWSGDVSGTIDFKKGAKNSFSIVIDKSSLKEKDVIFFVTSKEVNGEPQGASQGFVYTQQVNKAEQLKAEPNKKIKYHE